MAVVALIFGRGGKHGSQGISRKNLLPALGRPLLVYPLMAATQASTVVRVFLSTDDEEIASYGRAYGADIIERPPALATKEALMEDAIAHAAATARACCEEPPTYFVILMCNAPCILAATIDRGVAMLLARPELDSVITASRLNMFHPMRARRVAHEKTLAPLVPMDNLGGSELSSNRDSGGDAYFGDSGMTVVRPDVLERMAENLLPCRWMGRSIGFLEQPAGGADLDALWQLPTLEYWLRDQGFTESTTPYDIAVAGSLDRLAGRLRT